MLTIKQFSKAILWFHLFLLSSLPVLALDSNIFERVSIPNEYIVVIDAKPTFRGKKVIQKNFDTMQKLQEAIEQAGGHVLNKYYHAFTGMHTRLTNQALERLELFEEVQNIYPNEMAYLIEDFMSDPLAVRSWGLDRIDQRDLPLDSTYNMPAGETAHAYIVDSGIRSTHTEFNGRIGDGISTMGDPSVEDCLGHGTHVSGTVLGATAGVSSKTIVHPVRVFGCQGSTTFDIILKGLEWVIANHQKPAVVNMSLGAATTATVLDVAVKNTVDAGVTVVVAAGNSNANACDFTPAREPSAITVAASDINDRRAYFSNFGTCVDLFAPGTDITSSYIGGDTTFANLSGTSMASPHVCGAAALVASLNPTWTPARVTEEILTKATPDKIADPSNTPNKLLYVKDSPNTNLVVDAGPDVFKRLPDNNVTLVGKAKSPSSIVQGTWQQVSGPTALNKAGSSRWEQQLVLADLALGQYVFRFSATDAQGRSASDDAKVTIAAPNNAPVANAGPDQKLNPPGNTGNDLVRVLDGSASSDSDGTIAKYRWEVVEGNSTHLSITDPNAKQTQVKATTPGVWGKYKIRLTVTDDQGAVASDDMILSINAIPACSGGPDMEITLPRDSFNLAGTGSDPDGNAFWVFWWQVYGPNRVTIANNYDPNTSVRGFIAGSYTFRFYSIDDMNAICYDDMIVTVK